MATVTTTIKINQVILKMSKADPNGPVAAALEAGAVDAFAQWWGDTLPRHFESDAPAKYGYTPRTRGYLARKEKGGPKAPGWQRTFKALDIYRPLQFSGAAKAAVRSGYVVNRQKIGRQSVTTTFRMPFVRAGNIWNGTNVVKSTGQRHDLKREITAMTRNERTRFRDTMQARAQAAMKQQIERAEMVEV